MTVRHPLMVVGTADRNLIVYNLQNPQVEFKRIVSPLKYQTRCLAAFPDQQGFLVGSIEGRVGVHHLDDSQHGKNFTFKCHREGNEIYSVNSLNFHPVHHTFATSGSDGAFNFWDKDSKQRLKAMLRCSQPIPCSTFNNDGSIFAYSVCPPYYSAFPVMHIELFSFLSWSAMTGVKGQKILILQQQKPIFSCICLRNLRLRANHALVLLAESRDDPAV
ncbi:Protein RAE1 [Glycine max]|nr:Protein RAE1 [Glycine max]